jgi:histidinol-phosphate aminotransferase
MSFLRPNIQRMSAYQPGEQPQEAGYVKLNTNENPYPPSPRVLEALRAQIGPDIRLYPDPMATAVRKAVSRVHGVAPDWVLVGNGSDELLTMVMRAFVDPGEPVAYPVPTYSLYRTLAEIQGARPVEIPFPEDYSLPPRLCGAGGKVTLLANPNSPSATMVPPEQVAALARGCSGVLVIDEAYVDFAERDCLDLARRFENVIVLRTLSKAFNLCGLRVGFAIAGPDLIGGMVKVKDSYNVNRFGIFAAAAALDDLEYMRRNAEAIKRTRARLTAGLEKMQFRCFPSQANFVLARVPDGRRAKEIYQELKDRKILVRYFDRPRLDDCLRISVGTDGEIDKLLDALRSIL